MKKQSNSSRAIRFILPSMSAIATALFLAHCAPGTDNFALADLDRDGELSRVEMSKALQTAIYAKGDPDGDGKISYAEYQKVDQDQAKTRFQARDLNRDGFVAPDELKAYAQKNRSFDRLIDAFDSNGDEHIDRKEAAVFNGRLQESKGDNVLQKLYHLNASIQEGEK